MINKIKKNKKPIIISGLYLLLIVIISFLNTFNLLINISKYILILLTALLLFIGSYKSGYKRNNKGYISGLKISIITIIVFNVINITLLSNKIDFKVIIYNILIILLCVFAAILGINKKQASER